MLCLLQNRCGVLRVGRFHSALLSGEHNKAALRDRLQIHTTRRDCSAGTIVFATRCVVRTQHFGVAWSSQISTLCCLIVCGRARGVGPWSVCCSCCSRWLIDCDLLLSDRSLIARMALECVSCATCEPSVSCALVTTFSHIRCESHCEFERGWRHAAGSRCSMTLALSMLTKLA